MADVTDGETIGTHLMQLYEFVPFVMPDGRMGVHSMSLSASFIMKDCTLVKEIEDGLAAVDPASDEETMYLEMWRTTLLAALDIVAAAVNKTIT